MTEPSSFQRDPFFFLIETVNLLDIIQCSVTKNFTSKRALAHTIQVDSDAHHKSHALCFIYL